jgi:hypothetical protein
MAASILLLTACRNHAEPAGQDSRDSAQREDSIAATYMPVASFLMSEIREVDTQVLALYRYTRTTVDPKGDGRASVPGPSESTPMDSAVISVPEFNLLARQFLLDELAPSQFGKHYSENSFVDKTTQMVSFTYTPTDKNATLQRVDVLTMSVEGANRIRSIYLQRSYRNADTLVMEKMYWRAHHFFQVITRKQAVRDKAAVENLLKVVWVPEGTGE